MPGGVFWLDKSSHSSDVVYGEVRNALPMPDVMSLVWECRKHQTLARWISGFEHLTYHFRVSSGYYIYTRVV